MEKHSLNCGIVDLGSNTIRLSIYGYENNEAKLLLNQKETAGLAGYVVDNRLSLKGIAKACAVLNSFKEILANFNIAYYSVFATASLRNIDNTEEALQKIEENTGIKVDLLSGEEEARLGFLGVAREIDADEGLFIDIGGASTELLIFRNREIIRAVSMPLGCLNLYLRHVSSLQPEKSEMRDIKRSVLKELEKTGIPQDGCQNVIFGIGGTVRAVRKLYNDYYKLPKGNTDMEAVLFGEFLHAYKSNREDFIRRILQLSPERIHTIIPGMILLKTIAKSCGIEHFTVIDDYGLREGYLYERIIGAHAEKCS